MKIDHRLNDKAMTQTTQIHSICTIKKTEKPKLTETEEIISDILSVCDSLNKLHETLSRLAYVVQRRKIEANLVKNGTKVPIILR